ncbi:MAG TPA: hypothetical protein VHB97_11675, partial [Polyangia bacterium]|nr:hypothetical protein [Polyangia bacterium]
MRSALLLLALLASGSVVVGCVNNDASLSILQMQSVTESTACVATSTVGPEIARGTLDVSGSNGIQGYIGFPIVRNNEVSRMPSADSPELDSIQLIGANVSLSFTDPAAEAKVPVADRKFFWASAGGRLDPAGSAPLPIEVVPIDVVNALAVGAGEVVTVTAKIEPVGMQTSDRIVGGPIYFPIDICNGCLLDLADVPACPFPAGTVVTDTCIPDQDQVPTCCTQANQLLCGAEAPIATTTTSTTQPTG